MDQYDAGIVLRLPAPSRARPDAISGGLLATGVGGATPFALLQASLGLWFDPAEKQIRLINPRLPSFLDEVVLRNLRLGIQVSIWRSAGAATRSLASLRREGEIAVAAIHT